MKINKLIFKNVRGSDGTPVTFETGTGGSGSQPAPDSVDSETVKDGSLGEHDMDDNVKAGLHELENEENFATSADIAAMFAGNK